MAGIPDVFVFEPVVSSDDLLPKTFDFAPEKPQYQLPEFFDFPSDEELPPEKPKPWEKKESEFPVDEINDDYPVDVYEEEGSQGDSEWPVDVYEEGESETDTEWPVDDVPDWD